MASEKKTVVLVSSDGYSFEVEKTAAMQSPVIKGMLEEDSIHGVIRLREVTSLTLAMLIEYFNKHAKKRNSSPEEEDADLKTWDAEFVNIDLATLCDLIEAAHYLNIETLSELTCKTIADMLKDKKPDEIGKIFNFEEEIGK